MERFSENADLPAGLKQLFDRSTVSLSIADYTAPDCPLVGVNQAFCDFSGYGAQDVLGRNCRFLQPPGGAGPVRDRIRAFLGDKEAGDAKFLIPNVRKDGMPFLNLVYMSKLSCNGRICLVLGSQFSVGQGDVRRSGLYDLALAEDLRRLNLLTSENDWVMLGSFQALASSNTIIAQAKLDKDMAEYR